MRKVVLPMAATCIAPSDSCPFEFEAEAELWWEGEGPIFCGSRVFIADPPTEAACGRGHQFEPCHCERPICSGWRLVRSR